MWLLYAISSGLLYSISGIMTRHLLKGRKDAWAYSFYFSFIGALVVLPFTIGNYKAPKQAWIWLLGLGISVVIVLHNYLVNRSFNYINPSIQGSITKFRLLWILVLGVLFLGESFSYMKLIGTFLTIIASFIIVSKFKSKEIVTGAIMTFAATFIYASVITMYSFFLKYFNSVTLTFFTFLLGAILNLIFMPHSIKRVTDYIKTSPSLIIIANIFSGFAFLFLNKALAAGEQSRVVVLTESALLVTLILEYFILKEKDRPIIKLLAILLVIIGAILVKLG